MRRVDNPMAIGRVRWIVLGDYGEPGTTLAVTAVFALDRGPQEVTPPSSGG